MDIKGIMAISGYPGLFKMVSQTKNSIIVESLIDGKRMPAFNSYKISSLEDIAIYTEDKQVPLTEVFKKMLHKFENKPAIDTKAPDNELVKTFAEVIPDYDKDKVYVSHIKKVFSWYNMLVTKGLIKEESEVKETVETQEEVSEKQEKPIKPAKPLIPTDKNTPKTKVKRKIQTKPAVVKKTTNQRKTGE